MSLFWKFGSIFVLIMVIHLTNAAMPHRDYKYTKNESRLIKDMARSSSQEDYENWTPSIIRGLILCNGKAQDGLRPYLPDPQNPEKNAVMDTTHDGGWFRIETTKKFMDVKKSLLTVRHQCPMEHLTPDHKCATPYYLTKIELNLDIDFIAYKFDLRKMNNNTRVFCL